MATKSYNYKPPPRQLNLNGKLVKTQVDMPSAAFNKCSFMREFSERLNIQAYDGAQIPARQKAVNNDRVYAL